MKKFKKFKKKKENISIFIIPFIIITIIFISLGLIMTSTIKNYFYDLKKEQANSIAKSISSDLIKYGEMTDIANRLLDDKLLIALRGAGVERESYSDEILIELANALEVDEIYYYNQEGIIVYSNSGLHLGWQAVAGHPVYNFMKSNKDILVEDIRKDTGRDEYYKYGYIRNSDGTFIQVGVLAEKVQALLESFELQHHIEERFIDESIIQLYTLDSTYTVTASSNKDFIGTRVFNPFTLAHSKNKEYFGDYHFEIGKGEYEIYVPLKYERGDIVAMGVQYSTNDILPIIKRNTSMVVLGLVFVYASLLFTIYIIYSRNKKLVQLAYYDQLTGLPNAVNLKQSLNNRINKNDDHKAIIMIKLEEISYINFTYGYEYTDLLLKELSKRLKQLEAENKELFRFTEEKFVFYVEDYKNDEELISFLDKITNILQAPLKVNVDSVSKNIFTKIGVVKNDWTDKGTDELLRDAAIALNHAETSVNSSYSFFDEKMELEVEREEIIRSEIKAFLNGEGRSSIYLVYQPIIDTKTDKIVEFEALARMDSEQFGFVSPVEFIDIAEKNQLIIPLSNFILKEASSYVAELVKLGYTDLRIGINISSVHLLQDDFINTILNIIAETGISGKNLNLEITESVLIDKLELVNKKLRELRLHGIHISLDDFGTGYSSFDRLNELNVDTLKIDKIFIDRLIDKKKESHLTKDIISIAHKLNLTTVAEGVECLEQKNYLSEYNCDKLQGYLFSKPVAEEEAIELLKKHN